MTMMRRPKDKVTEVVYPAIHAADVTKRRLSCGCFEVSNLRGMTGQQFDRMALEARSRDSLFTAERIARFAPQFLEV